MAIAYTSRKSLRESSGRSDVRRPSSALETEFPFEALYPVAKLESWRKEVNRPLYHVHKWWANRLGSVFRTVILAGLLPSDADVWARFYERGDFQNRVVLDPFMGSGTTVGEALKLGCKAVGCDINPVAYFQVKKALEPCSMARLRAAFERLQSKAAPKIRKLYSSTYEGKPAEVLYTFWVKTLLCDGCGESSRLFRSWIFSSNAYPAKKPQSQAVCPKCGEINAVLYTARRAKCRDCQCLFDPNTGPANGQKFVCEHCGKEHRILETVRKHGKVPEHAMYALMLLLPDGRKVYKRPDGEDRALYEDAVRELKRRRLPIPRVEIPAGHNTDQARSYNYRFWHEMFNERQLLAHGTLLEEIMAESDKQAREAMLVLFSGTLEFNNMFCSFKGEGTGAVRHLFHHHILKPERTPLEANPWGTSKSSGSFSTLFERRLVAAKRYCEEPFEIRAGLKGDKATGEKVFGASRPIAPRLAKSFDEIASGDADALLLVGDSSRLPLPDKSVDLVVTDPPYFDNVHYSELADFFFCWLQKGLRGTEKAFEDSTSRSGAEVQGTNAVEFGQLLGGVFAECARVLKSDGTMAFTFHHSRQEAWASVAEAIEKAGLEVVAAHPVKAEMSGAMPKLQAKEPIDLDLVIVCKHPSPKTLRPMGAIMSGILKDAKQYIRRFNGAGVKLSRGDVRVVLMGGFLQAHSEWYYSKRVLPGGPHGLVAELEKHLEPLFMEQDLARTTIKPKAPLLWEVADKHITLSQS